MNILIIKWKLDENAVFFVRNRQGLTHSEIRYLSANAILISNSCSDLTKENG